jgi:hypothetical protein
MKILKSSKSGFGQKMPDDSPEQRPAFFSGRGAGLIH